MKCSCGFLIFVKDQLLICHPTGCGNRWDVPKGLVEPNETHIEAAVRELKEETGIIIQKSDFNRIVDLGEHQYQKGKNLHLFLMRVKNISIDELTCSSLVCLDSGKSFPEVDGYKLTSMKTAIPLFGKNLQFYMLHHIIPLL